MYASPPSTQGPNSLPSRAICLRRFLAEYLEPTNLWKLATTPSSHGQIPLKPYYPLSFVQEVLAVALFALVLALDSPVLGALNVGGEEMDPREELARRCGVGAAGNRGVRAWGDDPLSLRRGGGLLAGGSVLGGGGRGCARPRPGGRGRRVRAGVGRRLTTV